MTGHQLARMLLELPDLQVITTQHDSGSATMLLGIHEISVEAIDSVHIQNCADCKPTTPTVIEIWMD